MVYPYSPRTRMKRMEVVGQRVAGDCASGTATFNYNLPPGAFATGFTFEAAGTDQEVIATVTPWVDHDQTLLADSNFKFILVGATSATTNVTLAATGTRVGVAGMVVPTGDQYGAAAPVVCVHGYQIVVDTTSTSGTWKIAFSAVEI